MNRLHEAKKYGFLIDYRGILAELDTSIKNYQNLADQTQGDYDIDDLVGTVTNVSMEYKRLPSLHDAVWAIFRDVENKQDREQFRRVLMADFVENDTGLAHDLRRKVRDDFYDALITFGMCLKLALSSLSIFEEAKLVDEAVFADGLVQGAVRSHSISPASIEAKIRKAPLPRLFNLLGELNPANAVIEQIVAIVRAGDTRRKS